MVPSWVSTLLLLMTSGVLQTTAVVLLPYVPPSDEVLRVAGVTTIPKPPSAASEDPDGGLFMAGNPLDRAGWTVEVDSVFGPDNEGSNVLDGNRNSFWLSAASPTFAPHTITINLKAIFPVTGLTYLPRQDGHYSGNIGRHEIHVSKDGTNWGEPVAIGTYLDDASVKTTSFEPKEGQYVRLRSLSEAGDRGPFASAAEINVYAVERVVPQSPRLGRWGPTIDFPMVPVAGAIAPRTGQVVTWSAFAPNLFSQGAGVTVTATYDPLHKIVSTRKNSATGHDMFCPGISMDGNGGWVVAGGANAEKTSIYDPGVEDWKSAANMVKPRGYHSSTACSDGRIFTIGGSWSGGIGGKDGEIYDPNADTWTSLPGCPVAPMLTAEGAFRADNHAWLYGWRDGSVFQAGPSKAMNWYSTRDAGASTPAGNREDADAITALNIMYDAVAGKILTVGGTTNFDGGPATRSAHIITLGDPNTPPTVTPINSTSFPRTVANGVLLPDGQVFITGGQSISRPFSDENAILTPELFNPADNSFTRVARNSIPRTYHSIALLMPDATVFTAGGGLCGGCSTNHLDAQIYTPPYLLFPGGSYRFRPDIISVSATTVQAGNTLTIKTKSHTPVRDMSLVRYSSATHSINTDQRRVPLTPRETGTNTFEVTLPNDTGILIPGFWMLFVMDSDGVPSVAKTIQVKL
ncbi:MAG: hypothetical protein M1823_004269 [Watsoniomyces obsoletus]|nr:MAG: hypothetical protein M1823_004269 [Watsoniomyces obsoletus]